MRIGRQIIQHVTKINIRRITERYKMRKPYAT